MRAMTAHRRVGFGQIGLMIVRFMCMTLAPARWPVCVVYTAPAAGKQ
jgi:hypothetical protein